MSNDPLADLLVGVGLGIATIVGAWWANKKTIEITGHSIPEHLYNKWCELKNEILEWQKNNQHRELTGKIVVATVRVLDKLAIAPRNIERLFFKAETPTGEYITITEKDMPIEEALEMFPGLAEQIQVPISLTT